MRLMKGLILIIILFFGFIQSYADSGDSKNSRLTIPIPKISQPPKIDGRLDDACWAKSTRLGGLYKFEPVDGKPASEKTVVYLAYDRENFYAAFRCFDRQKEQIRANISKREDVDGDDLVGVLLDTFNSQRRGYVIGCNPLVIQIDGFMVEGKEIDYSLDLVYYSDGELNAEGYTVELTIPFKSLRFPAGEVQTIGFFAWRGIRRRNETSCWPPLDLSKNTVFDQEAQIKELEGIEYSKNIEILPFFTGLQVGGINDDGVFKNQSFDPDFGIGLKYGITPNVTLDFTYNPDFSQVEADAGQVDVNLR